MTPSHNNSTELIAQLFTQLGITVTTPELQQCGSIGAAMLRGIKECQVVKRALDSPPDIDVAAVARVVAGLRGGGEAIKDCSSTDLLHASDLLELGLRLENAQSGILAHLSRRLAPVAGDVVMWQTILDAGKESGAEKESEALENALRGDSSRSDLGVHLADLIRKVNQDITQDLAHEVAAQFVGVEKESLNKARWRGKERDSSEDGNA